MNDPCPRPSAPANSASRRDFLKTSTAAVVGGALVGSLSIGGVRTRPGTTKSKLR